MDSMLIVTMLKGAFKPSWDIRDDVIEIQATIAQLKIEVQHCYREANTVVDALAKWKLITKPTSIAKMFVYQFRSALSSTGENMGS